MPFLRSYVVTFALRLLILSAAATSLASAAQPPEITFATYPQSFIFVSPVTNSEVLVSASVCDAAGNTYVTGSFEGTATFGTNVLNSSGGFANDDVYVVKYDPAGNVLWARRAGGSGKDYGQAIVLDGAGGFYLSGTSDSSTFSIGTNTFNCYYKTMFLARYDGNGNVLWVQKGGSWLNPIVVSANMTINGLARDFAGNVIVGGSFNGIPKIAGVLTDPGSAGGTVLSNKNSSLPGSYEDIFLAKFAANGSLLWTTNYGGTNTEIASSVAVDSTGAIYVAGSYQLNTVLGAQTYTNLNEGILLAKFSTAGNLVWSSNLSDATNSNPGRGWAVVVDATDRVTLSFQGDNSSQPFNFHGSNYVLASGNINLWAQFDTSGALLWLQRSLFNGGPSTLAVDKQNNIYLGSNAGLTNGTVAGLSLAIYKCDFNGQPIWTNTVPKTGITLGLPSVSVDDAYITHVATTLTGGNGSSLTVGWTNIYPFTAFGYNQLYFTIASNFVAVPPVFLQQPTNMVFQPPQGLTNSAQVRAWPAPNYYWYMNGAKITNATNFFLTISPTTFTNQTSYFVVASNAFGMATSVVVNAQAGLAFAPAPPTNLSVLIGTTLTISGNATGTTAIAYQWRFNGTNIANATSTTLALQNIASNQAGNYTLVISNATGALTSAPPSVVTVLTIGSVDPSWTNSGIGQTLTLVRAPDGTYYAANGVNVGHINTDGTVDTNFINLTSRFYRWNNGSGSENYLGPSLIQREPDGKLLVAGTFKVYYLTPGTVTNVNRMARLNTNGTLDTTFNVGLGATNTLDGQDYSKVETVIRLTNGQYLVAGTFNRFNGQARTNLVRLNSNGSLDTTFPAHYATVSGSVAIIHQLALQADGKILIAGEFDTFDGVANHCFTRLNGDGTVDGSFVQTTLPATPFARVNTVLPLADGRILVAGAWANLTNVGVLRFNTNGSRDITWQGKMPGEAYAMSLLPSTKLIVTGNGYIRRTSYDGVIDATFNTGTFFDSQQTYAVVQEPSGNVMVGGSTFGMRRLLLEPAPVVLPVFSGGSGVAVVNGHFQFSACGGVDGQSVVVQASTNLVDWVNVSTNVVSGGCVSYADAQVPPLPNRYYRLTVSP